METIHRLAMKTCRQYADQPALSDGMKSFTFNELRSRTLKLAQALLGKGLTKGDRVAILMSNRTEHIELDLAIAMAGLVKVPLNYRLHPKEHEYILQHSGAKLLIAEEQLLGGIEALPEVIRVGEEYEEWVAAHPEEDPMVPVEEDDLFAIMYTSGTTGRPKGVMLSHRNFIAGALSLIVGCGLTQRDVMGHVAPLTHGSNFLSQCAYILGNKQVVFNQFEPKGFLEAIEREKISTVFLVPTMVNLMIHEPSFADRDLSSLRTINMAGSPIAVEKLKLALELLGPKLVETYGQVEAPMTITMMPREQLEHRPASCGAAGPFVDVRIVDEEGNEVPQGEIGEVICRGSLVMKGYWNQPEATSDTLKDGWLHTGDLGWMDPEGYVYLVDRAKDVIISGGANIYPREVEEVLNLHPAIKETCVFGIPDDKWGEAVFAHVVLREEHGVSVTEQELIELCREHLASFKKPKGIRIVAQLPKSSYGKILRKEIREEYRRNA
ncbi:class I adenylate-forming enzyme family protein [Ammoniphilus sp. YIM 78166]|uniref:class I adenylate-forming enzyme family protein n=1 Tax=Ammoniphilus sp. YIM 78166 TaxID=1644106 RepID=UPI00106F8DB2|nr:long-chain fatty acid--CoA ligase [Ammoniphilus sp. YIM 78166]